MNTSGQGWGIWFVGLPGSGKTTLARGVHEYLRAQGHDVTLLQMDKCRKNYFPSPEYTVQERERAYTLFVDEAAELTRQGKAVLMDGSAYLVDMRQYARQSITRFAEILFSVSLARQCVGKRRVPRGRLLPTCMPRPSGDSRPESCSEGWGMSSVWILNLKWTLAQS